MRRRQHSFRRPRNKPFYWAEEHRSKIRIVNKKIDDDLLMKKRREELDKWPTGKEVDFDEAVAYQKSLPDSKVWWKVMVKFREEGRMSVFPSGTAILKK